jgi:anti-sigma factor RsiW
MTDQEPIDDDLACQELVELVTDYLEGALPPATRLRLERHLAGCDGCQAFLTHTEEAIRAARALGVGDLALDERAEFLRLFRHWARG